MYVANVYVEGTDGRAVTVGATAGVAVTGAAVVVADVVCVVAVVPAGLGVVTGICC